MDKQKIEGNDINKIDIKNNYQSNELRIKKKVSILIKDTKKLEFMLGEDGQRGDYFSLLDVNKIEFTDLREEINRLIKNSEEWKEYKSNIVNDYKASKNYKESLKKEAESYKETIEWLKDEIEKNKNIVSELSAKNQKVNIENNNLSNKLESVKAKNNDNKDNIINEYKVSDQYKDEIKENYTLLHETWKEERDNYIAQISTLEKSRQSSNSKILGNEFEDKIEDIIRPFEHLGITYKREPIPIKNHKPDFLLEIMQIGDSPKIIGRIMIEAKNQSKTGNTTNKSHYGRLFSNFKNYESDYGLLVTELEPEKNFLITKIENNDNLYCIRYETLGLILPILISFIREKYRIQNSTIGENDFIEINNYFKKNREDFNKIIIKLNKGNSDVTNIIKKVNGQMEKLETFNNKTFKKNIDRLQKKITEWRIKKIIQKKLNKAVGTKKEIMIKPKDVTESSNSEISSADSTISESSKNNFFSKNNLINYSN